VQIDKLQSNVDEIHRRAQVTATSNRATARNRQQNQSSVSANFDVGDFVLVAKREFRGGEKLSLRWRGPYRIVATRSDYVFDVEDLATKVVTSVHSTRLRFFHDASLDITADLHAHLAHQNQCYEVKALRQLRYDSEAKAFSVLVSWSGFEEADDTWEPLLTLHQDIPREILDFLRRLPDRPLAMRALASLPT
jgi:hypothetical protein